MNIFSWAKSRLDRMRYNQWVNQFKFGDFVVDCKYHPCMVIDNDGEGQLTVVSLLTPKFSYCHAYQCIWGKISRKRAESLAYIYQKRPDETDQQHSERIIPKLLKEFGWDSGSINNFINFRKA